MTLLAGPAATRRVVPVTIAPMFIRVAVSVAVGLLTVGAAIRHWVSPTPGWAGDVLVGVVVLLGALLAAPLVVRMLANPTGRLVTVMAALAMLVAPLTPLGVTRGGPRVGVTVPVLGPVQLQHVAVLLLVLVLAVYLAAVHEHDTAGLTIPTLTWTGLPALLLVAAADLGPVVVLAVAVLVTTVAATRRLTPVLTVATAMTAGGAVAAVMSSLARNRILSWADGTNDHISRAVTAAGSAGWWGHGLGHRPRGVPELLTDTPIVAVAYAGGALGVLGWLAGWTLLLLLAVRALRAVASSTAAAVGAGAVAVVAATVYVPVAMAYGLIPQSGLTTAWLSAGRSSLIATGVGVGIALGVARTRAHRPALGRRVDVGVLAPLIVLSAIGLSVRIGLVADGQDVDPGLLPRVSPDTRGRILDRAGNILVDVGGSDREPLPNTLNVVGTAAPHTFGRGIEQIADARLRCGATSGWQRILGRCTPGDVTITLDRGLQQHTASVVRAAAAATGTTAGLIVVDADGRILAEAAADDAPTVTSLAETGSHAGWTPSARHHRTRPGSIVKIAVALAAADAGLLDATLPVVDAVTLDDGSRLGAWQGRCGGQAGQALLWHSCNPSTAMAAQRVGHQRIHEMLEAVGVGHDHTAAGVERTAASTAFDATSAADAARAAIGEGHSQWTLVDAVTLPLLVAAEDGTAPAGLSLLAGVPVERVPVVDAAAAVRVRELMRGCVTTPEATCFGTFEATRTQVAAKTGTAQAAGGLGSTGWCVGVAGDSANQVAFAARLAPTGRTGASGAQACRMAAEVLDAAVAVVHTSEAAR